MTLSRPNISIFTLRQLCALLIMIGGTLWVVGCDDQESTPQGEQAGAASGEMAGEAAGENTSPSGESAGEGAGETAGDNAGETAGETAGEIAGDMAGESTVEACAPLELSPVTGARFVERTSEWGLDGVQGTLLSVADLNGDMIPDLVVRRGGVRADIREGDEPKQHTWVLLNRRGEGTTRFEDFTEASGFLETRGDYPALVGRPNWVVVFADLDNDGDADAYSGIDLRSPPEVTVGNDTFRVDRESSEVLLNDGEGRFTLTYAQDPIRRVGSGDVPSGAAFLDVNRDGWLDLWLSQGGLGAPLQDRLFIGRGQGELVDQTLEYGLETQEWEQLGILNEGRGHSTAWSAAGCDLNRDGTPELLVGSYGRAPNHLWLGSRDASGAVQYQNHSVASGFAFDENQDWTGDQFARCFCASNASAPGCADAPPPLVSCDQQNWNHDIGRAPFRLGGNTGAVVCEDLDGDGDLDLITAEIRHWWAGQGSDASEVLINDGGETPSFSRPGRDALGLTIEHDDVVWDEGHISATIFDYDNDGYQDIFWGATDYPGNEALLFHNETASLGSLGFTRLAPEEGIDHHRSHGVVVGDFDGDGDLDLIVGHSRMRCADDEVTTCYPTQQVRAFENVVGDTRGWVQLALEGGESEGGLVNRDAVGALVEVTPLNASDSHTRTRYVRAGYGHFGQQNERMLTIGLGDGCAAEVKVTWPNSARSVETFRVEAKRRYKITPGALTEL